MLYICNFVGWDENDSNSDCTCKVKDCKEMLNSTSKWSLEMLQISLPFKAINMHRNGFLQSCYSPFFTWLSWGYRKTKLNTIQGERDINFYFWEGKEAKLKSPDSKLLCMGYWSTGELLSKWLHFALLSHLENNLANSNRATTPLPLSSDPNERLWEKHTSTYITEVILLH